jgi:hypothetical protein
MMNAKQKIRIVLVVHYYEEMFWKGKRVFHSITGREGPEVE